MMAHDEYLGHLGRHFTCHFVCHEDSGEFSKVLENCRRELVILEKYASIELRDMLMKWDKLSSDSGSILHNS